MHGFTRSISRRRGWLPPLAAALLLAATAAHAVVIHGRGPLAAAGNGFAVLELRGVLHASGVGLAVVEEDAIVDLSGHGNITRLGPRRVLLEGFGSMTLRSLDDRTRAELAGAHLRIRARGVGHALLKGTGHFMTDDQDGRWGPEAEVEFDDED